ncbi:hypothetical protein EZJ43_16005 [Pedobacter changchengzhani]|uniref:TonB C-terminal domain-containing protein n=1 Tax=Pedobacter changchengzhani TaxID=2529274 RepID=A0A4R5MI13_9SPHI|nr:hypothetical protein [Pedobacter changchengzhani]TDG34946.1 hypothetical protein EZJ43_16005 [Pedobacter changchengzhani]
MAIYPYDFKFIYNPDSASYYSLIKVVVKKDGFVKDIKSITGDSKALKKVYNDYFVNIFNWKSRLPKINPNNKIEDITLFFEIMPYTSIKKNLKR